MANESSSSQISTRTGRYWSIVDQSTVSATNFLTIATGAYFLTLPEQAKLVYLYTGYIGLVLLNTAAIFSAAPVIAHGMPNPLAYRRTLLNVQDVLAPATSILLPLAFLIIGPTLGWTPDGKELVWAGMFLLLQQFVDFNRRADYIFGSVKAGALFSLTILTIRLTLLLVFQPESASQFFMLLTVSSIPGAMAAWLRGRPINIGNGSRLKEHFSLARWNVLNAPLQWVALHFPVVLAGALVGPAGAAVIATLRSISTVANVFLELLETYVPVWMMSRVSGEGEKSIRSSAIRILGVGLACWSVAALMIALLGEWFLELVFGKIYSDYWTLLLILWLGNGLYFVGRMFGLRYRLVRRPVVELVGSLGGIAALIITVSLQVDMNVHRIGWLIVLVQGTIAVTQFIYTRYSRVQSSCERQ